MNKPLLIAASITAALISAGSSAAPKSINACEIVKLEDATRIAGTSMERKVTTAPEIKGGVTGVCAYVPDGFKLYKKDGLDLNNGALPTHLVALQTTVYESASIARKEYDKTAALNDVFEMMVQGGKFAPISGFGERADAIGGTVRGRKPAQKIAFLSAQKGAVVILVEAWTPNQDALTTAQTVARLALSRLP